MPIPGYEGFYEASNLGNVRSVDRTDDFGRFYKGKIRKPSTDHKGYKQIVLFKNGKGTNYKIYRLVWMAFNGEIPAGLQVNHIDEDKSNNRLNNLNLMTQTQNINWGNGNYRRSASQINHPSKSKQVIAFDTDGNLAFEFPSTMEAERNGFCSSKITACCRGRRPHHKGYKWRYKENDEKANEEIT